MPQEIEAKFYVSDLSAIERCLQDAGARCLHMRTYEINLRFDTPDGELRRQGRVLRLRRDRQAWLTYKAGRKIEDGLHRREEIEFQVSDFDAARQFLEALGYEVQFVYEKYRTVYLLGTIEIMLDELPYGDFVEIEGEPEKVRQLARELHLAWEAAIPLSYHALFERLRQRMHLSFRDLLFENFQRISISPETLGVRDALTR